MAIAFRAASTSETGASGATSITLSKPTGTLDNDVMVALIAIRDKTVTITAPSGWTLHRSDSHPSATLRTLVYWKRASSEGSTYQWTWTGTLNAAGAILGFSGVVTSGDPVDTSGATNNASGTSGTFPSITPAAANSMLVAACGSVGAISFTAPATYTEQADINTTAAGTNATVTAATKAGPSTTSTAVPSASFTLSAANINTGVILALAPQVGATTIDTNKAVVASLTRQDLNAATGTVTASLSGSLTRINQSQQAAIGGTALTLSTPASVTTNDALIAFISVRSSTVTITPPSGWTQMSLVTHNIVGITTGIYTRYVTGTEPTSHTWNFTNAYNVGGTIVAYRGAAQDGSPIGTLATQSNASGAEVAPSITPGTSNTMLLAYGASVGAITNTPPAGYAELVDLNTTDASGNITITLAEKTGGTVGVATGTATFTQSSANYSLTAHLTIRVFAGSAVSTVNTSATVAVSMAGQPGANGLVAASLQGPTDIGEDVTAAISGSNIGTSKTVQAALEGIVTIPTARSPRTATTNGQRSNSITITTPSVAQDDLMVAVVSMSSSTATVATPSGWTLLRNDAFSGKNLRQYIFYRIVTASAEPANYTWTFSSAQIATGGIMAYRGVSTTKPFNTHGVQLNAPSSGITAPASTGVVPGTTHVVFVGTADVSGTVTQTTGMTERWDITTSITE